MESLTIKKECFDEIAKDIFVKKGQSIDRHTPLYKYIDILALADIINNGNYTVVQRKTFSDRRESGELSNPGIECMLPEGQHARDEDKGRWMKYREIRCLSGDLFTSCFTYEKKELHAMWVAFTSGYNGVRIATTIGDFIESLDTSEYEVYIGKMVYSNMDLGLPNFERYIFTKNECYEIEKEIRMYFVPKKPLKSDDGQITLKVKDTKFISEVLLSPFIPRKIKGFPYTSIRQVLPAISDKIHPSHILEKARK